MKKTKDQMSLQSRNQNQTEDEEIFHQEVQEDITGFFSQTSISQKALMRIMREDPKLRVYDGFTIGRMERTLAQLSFRQRKHHIIYKVTAGEIAIPMELTGNVMEMQLVPMNEIKEELKRLKPEVAQKMSWIHIGAIRVLLKATFKEGINSPIDIAVFDRRIQNLRDACLGGISGNLFAGKVATYIYPKIAFNLADRDFSRVLTLHQDFKNKELMKEGNRPYSITYSISYALSNTHHSDLFQRNEFVEIPEIFEKVAHAVRPEISSLPHIHEMDLIIRDQPVFGKETSQRLEPRTVSFRENRMQSLTWGKKPIMEVVIEPKKFITRGELQCPGGWGEIEVIFDTTQKDNTLPCDALYYLKQPFVGRYQGNLKLGGLDFVINGRAGKIPEQLVLGIEFLEDHKPWEKVPEGIEFTVEGKRYRLK